MGWQPTFRAEGRIYANYIQAAYPDRKIAVLWQNDQFGRDLFRGLQEGLGATARMIVADIAIEADMSIDTQVDILKSSGAEVLVLNCAPPISARAIRARLNWIGIRCWCWSMRRLRSPTRCDRRGFRMPSA